VIRIVLADDHVLLRKGLIELLSRHADMKVCAEASSGREVRELVDSVDCDVLVLDLSLPDCQGLGLLEEVKARRPKLPVLILTMHPEGPLALRALKAGAAGYLTKETAPDELVKAIRRVVTGHRYVSAHLTGVMADRLGSDWEELPHEQLSQRELEVMLLLAAGKTISGIAQALRVSPKTVTTYRTRILHKMSMRTNAELTYYAMQQGLLPPAFLKSAATSGD